MSEKQDQQNQAPTEKRIEVCKIPISTFKDELGNPRKVTKKRLAELRESFEALGDFGVIVVDENNNLISGHQRAKVMLELYGEDYEADCKRLIGYTQPELKAINIKANTHAGEWDMQGLAEWTADLNLSMGIDVPVVHPDDVKVAKMEPLRFEKYDYVMVVFRNDIDYLNFTRMAGLEGKKVLMAKGKTGERCIRARAIWYDDLIDQVNITPQKK